MTIGEENGTPARRRVSYVLCRNRAAAPILPPVALTLLLAAVAAAGDLDDAKALQKAGKFEEALPKYQAAAKADPADAQAAIGLSQVLAGLGRFEEASKAVDAARKANPGNAALLVAKSRACLLMATKSEESEEPDANLIDGYKLDALKWVNDALRADPKHADALVLRGQIFQREGNVEQTRISYEEAVKAAPDNFDANFALAELWFKMGLADPKNQTNWSNASQYFGTAFKLDPTSGQAAVRVAQCKGRTKSPPADVVAAYVKAAELLPDELSPVAQAYAWSPRTERLATMQGLADAQPKNVNRKLYLAYAMMDDKSFEKALDVLEDAAKLEPKNPFVPLTKGDVMLAAGKPDYAIDHYQESMSLMKGTIDDETFGKLGKIGFQNKSLTLDQREKLWTLMWKNFPDRWNLANDVGLHYRDTVKDYKKSLEWYLRAAAVTDDSGVQNDTGLIYDYHMKDFDKAEPYYRKAVATGKAKGYGWNDSQPPGIGFRDGLNNMHRLLVAQKRWKDLRKFVEEDVPEDHGSRDIWLKEAEKK